MLTRYRMLCRFMLLLLIASSVMPFAAQESTPEPSPEPTGLMPTAWYVYLERGNHADTLIFQEVLTGDTTRMDVTGERYTPYRDNVMYFDTTSRQVMLAYPDSRTEPHPFIQLAGESRRVDWVVSHEHDRVAWTLTGTDDQDRLTTRTSVARLDGTNARRVYRDVDEAGNKLRALPVAFDESGETLYMDNHPDGIEAYTAFDQYASLFALDLDTGTTEPLPGEAGSNCICGAAVAADQFLRLQLQLAEAGSSFMLTIYDLADDEQTTLSTPQIEDFNTSGDVVISNDGQRAVYALASVEDFNTASQRVRTVFMLVDLTRLEQERLTRNPLSTFLRPQSFTEDNSAILLTSPETPGTWKIDVPDGRLVRVADATFIGRVGQTQGEE